MLHPTHFISCHLKQFLFQHQSFTFFTQNARQSSATYHVSVTITHFNFDTDTNFRAIILEPSPVVTHVQSMSRTLFNLMLFLSFCLTQTYKILKVMLKTSCQTHMSVVTSLSTSVISLAKLVSAVSGREA